MLFTWLVLASCIVLLTPESLTSKFQLTFVRVFALPLSMGRSICAASSQEYKPAELVKNSRYVELRNHLANTMQQLKQQHQKVEELSGLRDRYAWQGVRFILADAIIATAASHHHLVINRGADEGLAKGQYVLCDNCVVGTLCETGVGAARVSLISDPKSRIAVTIGDTGVSTILQGDGTGGLKTGILSIKHKIKVNDPVCAMKQPGLLNAPVIVGSVSSCRKDSSNPLLWDIEVEPACNLSTIDQVSVIVANPEQ